MSERNRVAACPSAGRLVALVDRELDSDEEAAVRAHLESCARCRELFSGLAEMAGAAETALGCLDDERIAALVDRTTGRFTGGLSDYQFDRARAHLAQCDRCRVKVEALTRACRAPGSVRQWLGRLVVPADAFRRGLRTPVLRWTAVAAVAALGIVLTYMFGGHGGAPLPSGRDMTVAREGAEREYGPAISMAVAERSGAEPPEDGARRDAPAVRPTDAEAVRTPPSTSDDLVAPRLAPPSQTTLMPGEDEMESRAAAAQSDLDRARKNGDAAGEARAALTLASLCHRNEEHEEAAGYYRQAAAAAEAAEEEELRVDALTMLGAVLAEIGEVAQARQELEAALQLARETGYADGERTAQVQLELLGEDGE